MRHLVQKEHTSAHECESNAPQDGIAPPVLVDALRASNGECPLSVHLAGPEISHAQHLEIVVVTQHTAAAPSSGIVSSSSSGNFVVCWVDHVACVLQRPADRPLPLGDETFMRAGVRAADNLVHLLHGVRCREGFALLSELNKSMHKLAAISGWRERNVGHVP